MSKDKLNLFSLTNTRVINQIRKHDKGADLDNTFKENTKYNDYADVRKVKFLLQMSNYYIR